MKDFHQRRLKAESKLLRQLPDANPSVICTPTHEESLGGNAKFFMSATAQDNGLVIISSEKWWLQLYQLGNEATSYPLDRSATSSVSGVGDDESAPHRQRDPVWSFNPRNEGDDITGATFIATDVVGSVESDAPGAMSSWNARSRIRIERVKVKDVTFSTGPCKISDTQFAAGTVNGHLVMFTHEQGRKLKEESRIWLAHKGTIRSVSFHDGTIVTSGADRMARLWDANTKKRVAVLHHNANVIGSAMSSKFVVTCSMYGGQSRRNGELRVYRNEARYPLVKIIRDRLLLSNPTLLESGHLLVQSSAPSDESGYTFLPDTISILDIERQNILARLTFGCRYIFNYTILQESRIIVVGYGGACGIVATLPEHVRVLVAPRSTRDA